MAWLVTLLKFLWKNYLKQQVFIEEPIPATPPPAPPNLDKSALLEKMCQAIKTHEGWFLGSRSYRNKNPGNLRRGQWKLAIGYDALDFAIFKTEADGMATLKAMIKNAATGGSKVYKPTDSLSTFFAKYAPSTDHNDPARYATVVAKAMGVSPFEFQLKELV